MFELKNYVEVLDELIEMMMDHDIGMYRYQRDVYLYIDNDGNGRLEIFENVGGNNWIDDDHITVASMRECTENWSDTWQDEQQIADALGCSEDHLIDSVCEWMAAEYGGHYEHDEISYNDVYEYINHHDPLLSRLLAARADLIEDQRCEYADRAEYFLDEAIDGADANAATATLKGELSGITIAKDDVLTLQFPKSGDISYDGQVGTLEDIAANFDYATATVTVADVSATGNIIPTEATTTFANQQAIVKFTLIDKTDGTTSLNATQLVVSDGTNTYTVNLASATSVIYAAIPGISGQTVTLTATVGEDTYTFEKTGVTFTNGQYYEITVKMTEQAPAPAAKAAAEATAEDLGKVIGADGNIYDDVAAATAAGTTARAIIAYVGDGDTSDDTYNHGLAIAMSDANGGSKCQWYTRTQTMSCVSGNGAIATAIGYKDGIGNTNTLTTDGHTHAAATAAASNNGTAAPTGTSGWFLPSIGQWNLIVQGLATKKAGSAVSTDISGSGNDTYKASNLNSVITAAGGTGFESDDYHSSTQSSPGSYVWVMQFGEGGVHDWGLGATNYVRSVLAF